MFNGNHEPSATSYNNLDLERAKKSQSVSKWPCGNGSTMQSTHLQPQNDQTEIWASKNPFIGLSQSVNVTPKCNCPGCYQIPDNQSYPADIAWHRTWFPRSYPVPVQSNDLVKLQGNHRWENNNLSGEAYTESIGSPYVQENGDKSIFYKPYSNLRNAEVYQSGMVSTVKNCKILKDDFPKQDEFITEYGHRFSSSVPTNPGYESFRGSNYFNQNVNVESCRQANLGQYNLHPNKRTMFEPFSKTVPLNANENRVPSTGHPNCKENILHTYVDQDIGKVTPCNTGQQLDDKHCRVLYQSASAKELTSSQEHVGLVNHFPPTAMEYHNLGYNSDLHNNFDKKFINSRNAQYTPRNNFPEVIKRTNQNFMLNTRKDYHRKDIINSPRPHHTLQAPPIHVGMGLPKPQAYGKFNSKENTLDKMCDLKAVSQKMMDGYQKVDEMMRNQNLPQIDTRDPFIGEKGYGCLPVQNIYKDCRKPDYSYPRRSMYDSILRNEIPIIQEGTPNYPELRNDIDFTRTFEGTSHQTDKLHYQVTSDKSSFSGNPLPVPEADGYRIVEKENTNKISHLESIRYEDLCKNSTSKISPLRLLRKKKFNHPKKESVSELVLESTNGVTKNENPPLDVRRFWATWAEEEEENVPQTQMVVLDYHNIDPEQAGLLNIYNSEPIRPVQLEDSNFLDVKNSQFEKPDGDGVTVNTRTLDTDGSTVSQNTEGRASQEVKQPELDEKVISNPEYPLGMFVVSVRTDTETKTVAAKSTVATDAESKQPVQENPCLVDVREQYNEKYTEPVNNCGDNENPVLLKKDLDDDRKIGSDDYGKMKEEAQEEFSEEATKSVSSDSSSQTDLPTLSDLPTSEYRKNKFLDYDNFCNGSFSTESVSCNSCPSSNAVMNAGISTLDEETGPDSFEIDEILQKLSGINFQTLEAKSPGPSSDKMEKHKTDKKIFDYKKESKTKKPFYKSSRTDQLTLENLSLSKPTIKFSIQKSHDLKISFKVLNNKKKYDEDHVEEPIDDGSEMSEDKGIVERKSRRRLITLKLKSDSDHCHIKDNDRTRKCRKVLKKKKIKSDRSPSLKTPILKIKKSRYMLTNGCEDEIPDILDTPDDPSKSCENESTAHGDFQVHETVESAKIKLTFKRNKNSGEKKTNLAQPDNFTDGVRNIDHIDDHQADMDTSFINNVETFEDNGCDAALEEEQCNNQECKIAENLNISMGTESVLSEENLENANKSPVYAETSCKTLQLESLIENVSPDGCSKDVENSKTSEKTHEKLGKILNECAITFSNLENDKVPDFVKDEEETPINCDGKNRCLSEDFVSDPEITSVTHNEEHETVATIKTESIDISEHDESDFKKPSEPCYEQCMPTVNETESKVETEVEEEQCREVLFNADSNNLLTPEVADYEKITFDNDYPDKGIIDFEEIKGTKPDNAKEIGGIQQLNEDSRNKTETVTVNDSDCGTNENRLCNVRGVTINSDTNNLGTEKNIESERSEDTCSEMQIENDAEIDENDEEKNLTTANVSDRVIKEEGETYETNLTSTIYRCINQNNLEINEVLEELSARSPKLEVHTHLEIPEENNNIIQLEPKDAIFIHRKVLRRLSCDTECLKQPRKLRKRSWSLNINSFAKENMESLPPNVTEKDEAFDIPVSEIPLPPGEAPPENCLNLEEYCKKRMGSCNEDMKIPSLTRVITEINGDDKTQEEVLKLPQDQKYREKIELTASSSKDEDEKGQQQYLKDFTADELFKTFDLTKAEKVRSPPPENEVFKDINQNESCIEYAEIVDELTAAKQMDITLEESSLYGGVFDEAIADDMEEEKVADDDKFRNIMQNCLENAKKFLNVGNLKLFSYSVEDLVEMDDDVKKREGHISKDVLLTSCEESGSEDLVLTDGQLLEVSGDFFSSLCPEDGSNICSEVLPVENWPYLEEEVASSPLKNKQEDSDLLGSFLETTEDESFTKKRMSPYGHRDKQRKRPRPDGNGVKIHDKRIKNYKSSSWQPKVVLFRISKNIIEELSVLPKESAVDTECNTGEDRIKREHKHEVERKNSSTKYSKQSLIDLHLVRKNVEIYQSSSKQKGIKRKKSRFRNLHTKKRNVPEQFDSTKENKSASQNSTNLVDSEDSEESSLENDIPKESSRFFSAKNSVYKSNNNNGGEENSTSRRMENSSRSKEIHSDHNKSMENHLDISKYHEKVRDYKRRNDSREWNAGSRKERHHSRDEDRTQNVETKSEFASDPTSGSGSKSSIFERDKHLKLKRETDKYRQWICEVCGFSKSGERDVHIQSHPFHCQSCHLAFKTETNFLEHLTRKHKDIRNQHHCLLCELSFDLEKDYYCHLETREHKHLESVEKNTINTLFTLLTGHPCPVLGPVELKPEWLPSQAGTVHFYHQATPLSLALQYLKLHHDNKKFSTETLSPKSK